MKIHVLTLASALAGAAAAAICAAPLAAATPVVGPGFDNGGSVSMPPGGPQSVYPRDQSIGGANPLVPFGSDPYTPFGVWTP